MGDASGFARRSLLIACGAAVLLVGLVAASYIGTSGASGRRAGPGMPVAVDRPAPALTRPLLSDGSSLNVGASPGDVVVVNFWASWCHACRREAPSLEAIWRSYRDRGVRFVGVDYEDGRSAASAAARSLHLRYPSVIDANGSVGDAFGILGLPTTYIIGSDGHIRFVVTGGIAPASFRVALDSVLSAAGTEVPSA